MFCEFDSHNSNKRVFNEDEEKSVRLEKRARKKAVIGLPHSDGHLERVRE